MTEPATSEVPAPANTVNKGQRVRANPWYALLLVLNPITVIGVGMWVQSAISDIKNNAANIVELKDATKKLTDAVTVLSESSKLSQTKIDTLDKGTTELKASTAALTTATVELSKSTAVMQEQMNTLRRDTDSVLRKLEKP